MSSYQVTAFGNYFNLVTGEVIRPAVRYNRIYTGRTTRYGLRKGTACRVVDKKPSNIVVIETSDGKRWLVADKDVKKT